MTLAHAIERRCRAWPTACALAALATTLAHAEERIADIRQGTNVTVAVAPAGTTLVVDLLGQLWSLPVSGGGAVPLTPAGEEARNPRLSPDGSRIVYQRLHDGQWDLWMLDVATSAQRALTSTPFNEREPDFSADGHSVVFAADRTGHYCLWSVRVDDGIETQLTEEPGQASYPSASAQGAIAYAHERGGEWSIRVLGRNGASTSLHTSTRPLATPSWRPGDGVLVFTEQESALWARLWMLILSEPRVLKPISGHEDIFASRAAWLSGTEFIYAADGQLWRRELASPARAPVHLFAAAAVALAEPPHDLPWLDERDPALPATIHGLARSADGRRTAFTALGDVWLGERGRAERLTDDAALERDPAFWSGGDAVVFSSDRTGQFELWRLSLGDRRATQITSGALQPRAPAVRPDGRQLAYLEAESFAPWATSRLKVRDWPAGTETTVATGLAGAGRPRWSDDGSSLSIEARTGRATGGAGPLRVALIQPLAANAGADAAPPTDDPPPQVRFQPPAPPPDYVVEVGRLFDGVSASYRRHVDIHVRRGRIAAVVARGLLPVSGTVIDARDRTVIPGLVDVHTHQVTHGGTRVGRAWLAYGVTTVREIASEPAEALERAELWASNRSPGPRLVVSAATAGATGDDPRLPLRAYPAIAQGFAHTLPRQATELSFPRSPRPESYPARLGLPDLATSTVELAISPGLALYQDGFSRLVASEATFVTGLAALSGLAGTGVLATPRSRTTPYRALFNLAEQGAWERPDALADVVTPLGSGVARLVRAGGRVAIGSEAPSVPFGLGFHVELAALARAGIGNDQLLRMATMGGALALGLERQIGSIEEGKLADFVVLEGDPLETIGAAMDGIAVVKGGVWYERSDLAGSER